MIKSTYDFCLLYTNNNIKNFGLVNLPKNNIFILANNIFAITKKKELKKTKLLIKNRKRQTHNTFTKFNGG